MHALLAPSWLTPHAVNDGHLRRKSPVSPGTAPLEAQVEVVDRRRQTPPTVLRLPSLWGLHGPPTAPMQ